MKNYDADLHIHSPHSIAVSQALNLDSMVVTCKKKGLNILGTGDVTQPDWRQYLKNNLEYNKGVYSYKDVYFIIQTELEDKESVHHVILLPNLKAGEELQKRITGKAKNVEGKWAGRPHVNMEPAEIVEMIDDIGGMSGPAHAFTPFKSIFRQNKFKNLDECYGSAAKKVHFLELGLSADTNLADRMKCLENVTFLSNSDAHSEGPQSLGREFNRFYIEEPSFDEISKALKRRDGRKIILNVGMEPKLGKYPMMFCKSCRKRIQLLLSGEGNGTINSLPKQQTIMGSYATDDSFIYYFFENEEQRRGFKKDIGMGKVKCVNCLKNKKNSKLALGVFDRIAEIADFDEPHHPDHRPPYIDAIPLVEMLRVIKGVKSTKAKSVIKDYDKIIGLFGNEFKILTDDTVLNEIKEKGYNQLADLISAFKENSIEFIPGGGGKYGQVIIGEI